MPAERQITLSNTLGHELQTFHPLQDGEVRMYTCGPTVYSYAHIGNFRSNIFADTLRRMLEYNGYVVRQVRNITDVGHLTDETLNAGVDRIEAAARSQNMTPWDIASHYAAAFLRDARLLNLQEPDGAPRATEYIQPMIDLIQRLVDRGYAYTADGDVYYDVSKFPAYGELSGNAVGELIAGARVEVGEGKRNPADFALWKAAGPDKIMRWASPWGDGVPGWHIECSAMAMVLLGEQIDIHTGGVDNVFPHHEDEIAQSEGATGKRFVQYWMHAAWLEFGAEKMSKSLGNVYTVADLQERGMHPLSYRYFTFQAHYRTPLNFTWTALEAAQTALYRLWDATAELYQTAAPETPEGETESFRSRFHAHINRDLDMPSAIAVIHDALGSKLSAGQKLGLLVDVDAVLALDFLPVAERLSSVSQVEASLLERRAQARSEKNWSESDALRKVLSDSGLEVKDTPAGQRWIRRDALPSYRSEAKESTAEQADHQA